MRIYTEVNFNWDDKQNKLVETSSKSFDYHGELALCDQGWRTTETYYDVVGNEYETHLNIGAGSRVKEIVIHKNGVKFQTYKDIAKGKNTRDAAHTKVKAFVKTQSADGNWYRGGEDYDENGARGWKTGYREYMNAEPSDVVKENELYVQQYEGAEGAEEAKILVEEEIDRLSGLWENITTAGDMDDVEQKVNEYIFDLSEKEGAVKTAYEDIFGEEGTLGEVKELWEAAVEEGKDKYTEETGLAVTDKEEGLEGTVVGREGELETLRGEAGENIRAAEAKVGAAGFASTGVGQTARDILAKEIGKEARGIDEGFTEERSDIKQTYLEKVEPLKKKYGAGGTAYDDYIRSRNIAATGKLASWKTATESFEAQERKFEEIQMPGITDPTSTTAESLASQLGGIAMDMEMAIAGITEGIGTEEALDPGWNPFESQYLRGLGIDDPLKYGLDPTSLRFGDVPAGVFDYETTPFYEPFAPDPGLEAGEWSLYDPSTAKGLLEDYWKKEEGGGGGIGGQPRKPGGQR